MTTPFGCNPGTQAIGSTVTQTLQGDTLTQCFDLAPLPDGATPDDRNSVVTYTLTERRFETVPVWTGTWNQGVAALRPGVIRVTVPQSVCRNLGRGSFFFAVSVETPLRDWKKTVAQGNLIVEYGADAPNPEIPYQTPGWTTQ